MIYIIKFFFCFLIILQFSCEADILDIETYRYQAKNDYFRSDLKDDLSKHHLSISSLQKKMKDFQMRFNSVDTAKIDKPNVAPKTIFETPKNFTPEVFAEEPVPSQKKSQSSSIYRSKDQIGFYILPFVALQTPGEFSYKFSFGNVEIDQDLGFSTGWRVGVEGPYLFLDAEFSYHRNKFQSLQDIPLPFKGEAEGFSFLINTGTNIKISERFNLILGGGFGAMNQEIGFDLSTNLIEEESTLFSYQFFTGLNFALAEHLQLGLRYRWMRVGEMEFFTARDLHLAELALGYVF